MDIYASFNNNGTNYQLLQLPPTLLDELKQIKNENVYLKSSNIKSSPYFITPTSVFKLRVQNHSNYQTLVHCHEKDAIGFCDFNSSLVPQKVDASLDLSNVLNLQDVKQLKEVGNNNNNEGVNIWDEFKLSSLSSTLEFDQLVKDQSIFMLGNKIIKPIDSIKVPIVIQFINEWILYLNLQSMEWDLTDFDKCSLELSFELIEKCSKILDYPFELCKAVIQSFLTTTTTSLKLNHSKIIKLISLDLLMRLKRVKKDELMIQLRMVLNSEYTPDLDPIELISGCYYTMGEEIIGIDISDYKDIKTRLIFLFEIKREWEIDEIKGLISDLNINKIPINKFMLKYLKISNGKCQLK